MSLINKLLQDLEKRQASEPEVAGLGSSVRAVSHRRRLSAWLVALLLVAGAGFVAVTYLEHGSLPPIPWRDAPVGSPAASRPMQEISPAVAAAEPEAAIEAALLAPVFQLSAELSRLPTAQPAQSPVTIDSSVESDPDRPVIRPAPSAVPAPAPPSPPKAARSDKPQVPPKSEKAPVTAVASNTPDQTMPLPAPKQAAMPKPTAVQPKQKSGAPADKLEEVTIPAQSAPIEKQVRSLTAFERAETEFRNGVARLRQGRVSDAETAFRTALAEDASHLASRQALIGLLIDLGRNIDAEQVLQRALDFNPRQPRHAMLLARLELERGDTEGAILTLESVRQYVGVDAEYLAFYAAALERAGRHEESIDRYRDALAVVPGNSVWMMGLGISLRAANRTREALVAFERAAAARMPNPELQAYVEAQARELRPNKR